MPELNRKMSDFAEDDATEIPSKSTPETQYPRGVEDWIEDLHTPTGVAGIRLVQNEAQTDRGPFKTRIGSQTLRPQLLKESVATKLRARWSSIQAEFVDEPVKSVKQAGELINTTVECLTEGVADQHALVEKQLEIVEKQLEIDEDTLSTEELRVALQRYRTVFIRLLTAA